MIVYIALIALSLAGFALHEFALNRDLRVGAPGKDRATGRRHLAHVKTRCESVAAGTRLPTRPKAKVNPLALTQRLSA